MDPKTWEKLKSLKKQAKLLAREGKEMAEKKLKEKELRDEKSQ